ncbi:DNA-binding response regulator [Rhodobacter sphaeroides]|jgi:DNA-binding NarL/FixJ family response regulator|uniref:Transcriptional regulator, LuxR family n=3 Tax=Cereibacter TaxID=1653176 RepID=Q3J142_CERS4|nr:MULTISPECIES: response regulator transcription factor [Cereibacter]RDS94598.1 DNA-binding response regulator [Cereibacter sphaeroides f. sp. denitrificans]ABA79492.2 Transcriptional regulator, LuxR family [Cereibacter sphaeroides 2.4.1]AMJ47784.1 LuxR family transcriptional regulator [Cereibacter sphaeroides]ANS34493.1 LuxR family transcriptional regulator [Cereibacter sphaeroides]ATN63541.1 LuxR family transcriptional regulator [Cereibacter sphaeroides]
MNHSTDSFSKSLNTLGSDLPATAAVRLSERRALVMIDPRTLERECLVRCVELAHPSIQIVGFGSFEEWRSRRDHHAHQVILYSTGNRSVSEVSREVAALVTEAGSSPVVVIGAANDLREMIAAFDCGARSYLPSSVGIDDIVEASRLATFDGIFLPTASLTALRGALPDRAEPQIAVDEHLTERQRAVCDALRRGKSNKIIAGELNLCESTVKVHIRNIMKKLGAKNRTEAAFKLNSSMFAGEGRLS